MTPTRSDNPILNGSICPYCNGSTEYVDSSEVYGKSYGMVYYCAPCRAWVGVHKGTDIALGRLANGELRKLKIEVHNNLDILWKPEQRTMTRKQAYRWLADKMGLPIEETHIGMFSEDQCKEAIKFLTPFVPS